MKCISHPRLQQYTGGVTLVLLSTLLITWLFYGLFCMADCGKVATNCTVIDVQASAKVCLWNSHYYAYSGIVTFQYLAQQVTSVRVGCGDTAAQAITRANHTDPLGSTKMCWYSVLGNGSLFLSWHAPTAGLDHWLRVNVWYSMVACICVLVCGALVLVHHCRKGYTECAQVEERDDLTFP